MYVARWNLTAKFSKTEETIALLRRWEGDVGQRIGWRPGSVRIVSGFLGAALSSIELEVRCDGLDEFEAAWRDMQRNPAHKEYVRMLDAVVVAGTDSWTVHFVSEAPPVAE